MASNKKIKARKIRMSISATEEKKLDKEIEKNDNFSVGLMIGVLVVCFIIGISLGYVLYEIAINGAI